MRLHSMVEVWDANTGTNVIGYGYNSGIVHSVAWSPNGQYLAVGSSDGLVQVWNVATQQNIYNYSGHTGDVLVVAWSLDGQRIASGGSDGTAQVWDATTGAHAYIYRGHADFYWGHFTSNAAVNGVAWSPDGQRIASGSNDTTVQVWQAI
jgi:eukaryotic-like serine/threonine-protein kinase